jgi:hypothetical protein
LGILCDHLLQPGFSVRIGTIAGRPENRNVTLPHPVGPVCSISEVWLYFLSKRGPVYDEGFSNPE